MVSSRRVPILVILTAFAWVCLGGTTAAQRGSLPQDPQQQQQGSDSDFPPIGGRGRGQLPVDEVPSPKRDPQQQLKEAQKKISADVDHLLQLAKELKDESDKTKETDVLSLPLIHKTEEIEKLAKQIRDLARAN
jgi:hypothetical protein